MRAAPERIIRGRADRRFTGRFSGRFSGRFTARFTGRFAGLAALVGAGLASLGPARADVCADPAGACARQLSPVCQRLGAGSLDASCQGQFDAYRECLVTVAETCPDRSSGPGPSCSADESDKLWALAQGDNNCFGYEAYLASCPNSRLANFAKARLRALSCGAPAEAARPASGGPERVASGSTFRDCPECPEMVAIRAGAFRMGSPDDELGRYDDEGPVRTVRIAAFAMGKTEVTRGDYARFVRETGHQGRGCFVFEGGNWRKVDDADWRSPGFAQTDADPVVCVSWEDAQAYVAWLNRKVGAEVYRLPSEAEWEYAARARTTTRFSFGDSDDGLGEHGWYRGNAGQKTHPVGGKRPNAFELSDMHGNVWEWVQDCRNDSYRGAPIDGTAWMSGDCSLAVLRGGSWSNGAQFLRSATRDRSRRDLRYLSVGFRLARTLPGG